MNSKNQRLNTEELELATETVEATDTITEKTQTVFNQVINNQLLKSIDVLFNDSFGDKNIRYFDDTSSMKDTSRTAKYH
ncbi:hypothetical protein L3V82_07940 [Thiotrichales bacterium 19S3-7]|nr:hypothetical protein [Thiotrichales bacterium 19S3-7]MCF6802090.1 hypothetical protein [Thiotrichales bacterium 19S3-11]